MLGLSSSDDEDNDKDDAPPRGGMDDDDLFGEEAQIVGGGGVNESFESAQDKFDGGNTDAAVVCGDLPPRPCPVVALPPLEVQDTGDIEVKGMTQLASSSVPAFSAQVDVRHALQRAASSVKAQKTKMHPTRTRSAHHLQGQSSSYSRRTNTRLMAWPPT
jgi:hypothetical protein